MCGENGLIFSFFISFNLFIFLVCFHLRLARLSEQIYSIYLFIFSFELFSVTDPPDSDICGHPGFIRCYNSVDFCRTLSFCSSLRSTHWHFFLCLTGILYRLQSQIIHTHRHRHAQSISLSIQTSVHLSLSFFLSVRLSCVHNTPLKAGLHVLASDWLQCKKMMSFLGERNHTHTHTQSREKGSWFTAANGMRVKMGAANEEAATVDG